MGPIIDQLSNIRYTHLSLTQPYYISFLDNRQVGYDGDDGDDGDDDVTNASGDDGQYWFNLKLYLYLDHLHLRCYCCS